MMILIRLVLLGLLFHTATASGADEEGNFAMKGAGFLPCETYVKEREKKSNIYYLISGWLEGFITAHNSYTDDTYDITSFESLELLLRVMQNHCESNPRDRLYSVINSIIIKLEPDRLMHISRRVQIREGERTAVLYRETIRRIHVKLTQLGLYKGEINDKFTAATKSALMAFQSDLDFEMTGFPDQTTLWRLLRD